MTKPVAFTKIVIYVLLILLTLLSLFPIMYAFFGSFKSSMEFATGGSALLPKVWRPENYVNAWNQANFARYTWNSIFISFFGVVGTLIMTSVPAYVLARGDFPGRKFIMGLFLGSMFLTTGSITLYPIFALARTLGVNQSLWGIVMVYTLSVNATYIFLLMGFIKGIPKELDEAATIDGCGFFGIYHRIVMPLCRPMLATVALLMFRFTWNDYLIPMVFTMSNESIRPLIVGVIALSATSQGAAAYDLMLAGTSISLVPVIVIYIFTNKQFISGMTTGAIK